MFFVLYNFKFSILLFIQTSKNLPFWRSFGTKPFETLRGNVNEVFKGLPIAKQKKTMLKFFFKILFFISFQLVRKYKRNSFIIYLPGGITFQEKFHFGKDSYLELLFSILLFWSLSFWSLIADSKRIHRPFLEIVLSTLSFFH